MTTVVAVDKLAKVFGGLHAVDGVSLEVVSGERRALIEPGGGPAQHPVWRDEESALRATTRALALLEHQKQQAVAGGEFDVEAGKVVQFYGELGETRVALGEEFPIGDGQQRGARRIGRVATNP